MKSKDRVRRKANVVTTKEVVDKLTIPGAIIVPDEKRRERRYPDVSKLQQMMERITTASNDNLAMMELLPDLKLVKRILVPSILSPKDLSSCELRLTVDSSQYTEEIDIELVDDIENHFRSTFDLEGKLSTILDEALFDTGSYCSLVVPESSLVDLIKNNKYTSMESYTEIINKNKEHYSSRGILHSMESAKLNKLNVLVSDNPNHILTKGIKKAARASDIYSKLGYSISMEGYEYAPGMIIGSGHGENGTKNNNPMVMKIPSDTIIPVHTPSDPSDHLGYFIILDENGSPVTSIKSENHMYNLKVQIEAASKGNSLGGLIQSTGFSIGGINSNNDKIDPNLLLDQYINTIEAELEGQLKKGAYGNEVEVSRPQEVYRTMLSRYLSKKQTRLLYVPKEIVSYIAFDYDDYGVGKSLLEDTKIFGSLRAILLFAEVMAGVKNSVGRTKLDLTLDEDDPDPAATVDAMIHHFAGLQTESLPLGRLVAGDIVRSLQKASVDVNINGGEAFPGTKSEVQESTREYKQPDQELSQTLRRMQYSGFGIPAEIVDSAMQGELATVVVSRNQLYAKQVMEYAAKLEKMVTSFIKLYIRCSGELMGKIEAGVGKENVALFISSIKFTLPSPDLAGIKSQSEAFVEYSDAVDKAIEVYVTEDMFRGLMDGDVDSGSLASLRLVVANLMKREWMAQQNIMSEIATKLADPDITTRIDEHNKLMLEVLSDVITRTLKAEDKIKSKIDKITADKEEAERKEQEKLDAENAENDMDETGTEEGDDLGTDEDSMGDDTEEEPTDTDVEETDEEPTDEESDDLGLDDEGPEI